MESVQNRDRQKSMHSTLFVNVSHAVDDVLYDFVTSLEERLVLCSGLNSVPPTR